LDGAAIVILAIPAKGLLPFADTYGPLLAGKVRNRDQGVPRFAAPRQLVPPAPWLAGGFKGQTFHESRHANHVW
jgi:hypothetical protein